MRGGAHGHSVDRNRAQAPGTTWGPREATPAQAKRAQTGGGGDKAPPTVPAGGLVGGRSRMCTRSASRSSKHGGHQRPRRG